LKSQSQKEHHPFGRAKTGATTGCWFSPHSNNDNPPILNIKFGAGAVRSITILVEPEPETQQDAVQALAPTALAPTAPNLMFNIGGLSKMSTLAQFLTFPIHFHDNSTNKKSD
jgi:hypothetical protein